LSEESSRRHVVDHVVPHRGDWNAFVTGKLQSLCEPCHKSAKRQIELRGYRSAIGLDGHPPHPNHPFNRAR
jgi:5-methylcytosine-specific restriction enzyme A